MTEDNQRRGPWSRRDKDFIAENYDKMTADEIARRLRRNADMVYKYIRDTYGTQYQDAVKLNEVAIKQSPIWRDIKQQFTQEEQTMFLFHWGRITSQFKDDVLPTEEMQVIDTIKLDILMNRALKDQHKCTISLQTLESLMEQEMSKDPSDRDSSYLSMLDRQIAIIRTSLSSLGEYHKKMLENKNKILSDMKATREARIKHIESSRQNFTGWIRQLLDNPNLRIKLGQEMEKIRLASQKEYERLSSYHQYLDGEIAQPLLTPDNVILEETKDESDN